MRTQGPWSVDADLNIIGKAEELLLGQSGIKVIYEPTIATVKTTVEDAALLAAAPDLAEALEEIATASCTSEAAINIATAALNRIGTAT